MDIAVRIEQVRNSAQSCIHRKADSNMRQDEMQTAASASCGPLEPGHGLRNRCDARIAFAIRLNVGALGR
ncbi:hypothetical protein ACVWY2_004502 [Bradyrhizobium sp. JR6.1]